jgi:hypothetical protein
MPSTNLPNATDDNPYASYTLDHHGLVADMIDELGLVERIDAMIRQELSQRQGACAACKTPSALGSASPTV